MLDDKDNEKIYKYNGHIRAGGKFKGLVVEIDNGGSFINYQLGITTVQLMF